MMGENMKDTSRAIEACKVIIDGRDPSKDYSSILVTAEHAIAALLLAVMNRDPRKAAAMLNEALIQGVEERLALFATRSQDGGAT